MKKYFVLSVKDLENLKIFKYHVFSIKHQLFLLIKITKYIKTVKIKIREEESTGMLKILGLI